MTREKLQEFLLKPSKEGAKIFRQYGDVLKFLVIWEAYVRRVEYNTAHGIHPAKGRARMDIMEDYGIAKDTFYAIRDVLRMLCEDV